MEFKEQLEEFNELLDHYREEMEYDEEELDSSKKKAIEELDNAFFEATNAIDDIGNAIFDMFKEFQNSENKQKHLKHHILRTVFDSELDYSEKLDAIYKLLDRYETEVERIAGDVEMANWEEGRGELDDAILKLDNLFDDLNSALDDMFEETESESSHYSSRYDEEEEFEEEEEEEEEDEEEEENDEEEEGEEEEEDVDYRESKPKDDTPNPSFWGGLFGGSNIKSSPQDTPPKKRPPTPDYEQLYLEDPITYFDYVEGEDDDETEFDDE